MICAFTLSGSRFVAPSPASKLSLSHIATVRAPTIVAAVTEEEAKAAWLAKLETPTWGKAAAAISEVVADAAQYAALADGCDTGDDAACEALSKEEEAKKAWLASIDVPAWVMAAKAMNELAAAAKMEEAAKKVWLAKLDAPTWGPAAKVISGVMDADAQFAECDAGADDAACLALSKEEEAKKAWLAKLDVPWGQVAAAVYVAQQAAAAKDEEAAKRAWIASLDEEPSWLRGKMKSGKVVSTGAVGTQAAEDEEQAAKRAWLASLDEEPSWRARA